MKGRELIKGGYTLGLLAVKPVTLGAVHYIYLKRKSQIRLPLEDVYSIHFEVKDLTTM